jgi:hypothetical protein
VNLLNEFDLINQVYNLILVNLSFIIAAIAIVVSYFALKNDEKTRQGQLLNEIYKDFSEKYPLLKKHVAITDEVVFNSLEYASFVILRGYVNKKDAIDLFSDAIIDVYEKRFFPGYHLKYPEDGKKFEHFRKLYLELKGGEPMKTQEQMRIKTQYLDKAHYYVSLGNTLILTASIFLLAFVTALTLPPSDSGYAIIKLLMLGTVPLGLIILFFGISNLFRANLCIEGKVIEKKEVPTLAKWGLVVIVIVITFVFKGLMTGWAINDAVDLGGVKFSGNWVVLLGIVVSCVIYIEANIWMEKTTSIR